MSRLSGNVLVLGDGNLAPLAIIRSLGRMGLDVHLGALEKSRITRSSRYVSQVHDLGNPLAKPDEFLAKLLDLVSKVSFQLIIPTSDRTLVPLIPHQEALNEYSILLAPNLNAFEIASNKSKTIEIAKTMGFRVPQSRVIASRQEALGFDSPHGYPVVLKPVSSVTIESTRRHDVRVVRSRDELVQSLPEMVSRCPVLVQEFCSGKGTGISVIAKNGILYAAFQHERLHEPPDGGAGSYRRSTPLDNRLLSQVKDFLKATEWSGPAMFEFKQQNNEVPALMEINGRFWGSLALAINSGVDFPRIAYELFVERHSQENFTYRIPHYTRHTYRDFFWLISNFRGPSKPNQLRLTTKELLKECRNIVALRESYDVESITDPLPALVSWWETGHDFGRIILSQLNEKIAETRFAAFVRCHRKNRKRLADRLRSAESILFLCYGNINRSPLADAHFKKRASSDYRIDSAGFFERVERPSPQLSQEVADSLGVDLSRHRSKRVTKKFLKKYDVIVVMDRQNLQMLRAIDAQIGSKAIPLAAFDEQNSGVEIQDPHGKSREKFSNVYKRVIYCVDQMIASIA